MKINRHGRAKILTQQEIQLIFSHGLDNDRDITLFGVCLFSACRIREACTLLTEDIYTAKGQVRPRLIISFPSSAIALGCTTMFTKTAQEPNYVNELFWCSNCFAYFDNEPVCLYKAIVCAPKPIKEPTAIIWFKSISPDIY
jgi:hypothetical protein